LLRASPEPLSKGVWYKVLIIIFLNTIIFLILNLQLQKNIIRRNLIGVKAVMDKMSDLDPIRIELAQVYERSRHELSTLNLKPDFDDPSYSNAQNSQNEQIPEEMNMTQPPLVDYTQNPTNVRMDRGSYGTTTPLEFGSGSGYATGYEHGASTSHHVPDPSLGLSFQNLMQSNPYDNYNYSTQQYPSEENPQTYQNNPNNISDFWRFF
jgi:hypothetical protein